MTYPSSERVRQILAEVRSLMDGVGLPLHIISGGGTGSEEISKSGCTETRIGSYAYEGMTRVSKRDTSNPIAARCGCAPPVSSGAAQSTDRRRGPEGLYQPIHLRHTAGFRASQSFYQGNVRGARPRGHHRIIAYIYRWPAALLYSPTRWHDDEFARSPIRHARWRSRGHMGGGRTRKEPVTFQFNEDCHGN